MSRDLGYEPFLPFELKAAEGLFEYASRRRLGEISEDFLRRRGFIAAPGTALNLDQEERAREIEENQTPYLQPIVFNPGLLQSLKNSQVNFEVLQPGKARSEKTLKIYALNGGRIWLRNNEVVRWRTSKTREALFFILESSNCTRDELFEALWPDEDPDYSPHLLNTTLYHLRKAIAPVELKLNTGRYRLEGSFWYDSTEFYSKVTTCVARQNLSEEDLENLTAGLDLYKRDFLDQFYSNWATERQQQLLQIYLNGLEKVATVYQDTGKFSQALALWRQLLIKDSYNEEAHRSAISCLIKLGKSFEARRQFDHCVKALEELDLQPSPETKLLLLKLA